MDFLVWGKTSKATVLALLTTKLFANIQFDTLDNSELVKCYKLSTSFSAVKRAVSSAKNLGTVCVAEGRSFT